MVKKNLNLLIFTIFVCSQDLMAPPNFFDRLGVNLRGFGNDIVGFFNSPPPPPLSTSSSPMPRSPRSSSSQLQRVASVNTVAKEIELCKCQTPRGFVKNSQLQFGCLKCRKPRFAKNYVLTFLDLSPLKGPIIFNAQALEWQWKCNICQNNNCVTTQECGFRSFFGLACSGKRADVLMPLVEYKGKTFQLPQIVDRTGSGHSVKVDAQNGSFFLIDKDFIQVGWLNLATDRDIFESEELAGMTAFSVDDQGNKIPKIRTPDKIVVYELSSGLWRPIATLISGEVRRLSDLVLSETKRKHCSCFWITKNGARYLWGLRGYDYNANAPATKTPPFFLDPCGLDCLKLTVCPNGHFGRLPSDPNMCRFFRQGRSGVSGCSHNFNDVIVPTPVLRSTATPGLSFVPPLGPVLRASGPRPQFVGRPDAAIESARTQDLIRQRKAVQGISAPTTLARPTPSQTYFGACKKCGKGARLQRLNSLCQLCIDADLRVYEQKLKDKKLKLQQERAARRLKIGQVDDLVRSQDSVRRDFYGQENAAFQAIQGQAARENKAIQDRMARERLFAEQTKLRGSISGGRDQEINRMKEAFSAGRNMISAQDESRKTLEAAEKDARRKLELGKRRSLRQQRERNEAGLMEVQDLRAKEIEKEKASAAQQKARFAAPQKDFKCVTCYEFRSPENFAGRSATGGNICQDCMFKAANAAVISPIKISRGQSSSQKRQGSGGSQKPVSSGEVGILKTLRSEVFNTAVWNPFSD